ncbi:MAG TPA: hypothetical protein VF267_05255 [Gammaproteobacteria bacterium]
MKIRYSLVLFLSGVSQTVFSAEAGVGRDNDTPDAAPPSPSAETASQASGMLDAWEMLEQWFNVDAE